MTVAELKIGQSGCVTAVDGDDTVAARLMEMGVTPGITIKLVGSAPLGDPLELEVRGYRLSIRKTEAARIQLD